MRPHSSARRPRRARPRGIALLMALAVVMLLTFFMSEYFFATGLELRGMTTFKDAQQARMLARSVFKAVQIGLLQDEVEFFKGYEQVAGLLTIGAVPWNQGLLLTLEIAPQDHLFNLNQNFNSQPDEPQDRARRWVFLQLLDRIETPVPDTPGVTQPLAPDVVTALYAALFDFIDGDNDEYLGFSAVRGAEQDSYVGIEPALDIKNGQLDRLEETRLVRGFRDAHIPWGVWEHTVTTLPHQSEATSPFTERINVNVASRDEIALFLSTHFVDPNEVGSYKEILDGINAYAQRADEIADYFVLADGKRQTYDPTTLQQALEGDLGIPGQYGKNFLFSTVNQYYRIRAVTEVAGVRARLEAMLYVPRDPANRLAKGVPKVLWETVN
jgi:type II secretory pathway component PulK